jgi:predicted AAA+ superfamily ATPase
LTEFGHLAETFAVGEILKQVSWSDEVITASHFRTESGDEVDLVLETWDGRVAGFEIKAGTRIKDPDLKGLRLLRDRLGDRFVDGFVLNLGELAYRKADRIAVMPLSALWALSVHSRRWRAGQVREQGVEEQFLLDTHIVARHGGRQARIPGGHDRSAS